MVETQRTRSTNNANDQKNVDLKALSSGNKYIPIGGLAQSAGGVGGDGGDCDSLFGCPDGDRGGEVDLQRCNH